MKTRLLFACLVCMSAGAYGQTGLHIPEMEVVDQSIQNFMQQWNIPGAAVAVAVHGKLVYARGFGFADVDAQEPVQPNARFRIASISKPLTAAAIFHLIEAGKLSLDDQVFGEDGILNDAAYLPLLDGRMENVKVRHLLAHTAGWTGSGQLNIGPMFSPLLIAQILRISPPAMQADIITYMTTRKRLTFNPGSRVVYANFGYTVLGRIIETLSGQSYEDYLQDHIFEPVGATSFALGKNLLEDRQENEVVYYHPTGTMYPTCYGTGQLVPMQYGGVNVEAMDAHGGWIASAPDLLRVALAMDGKETRPDLLRPSSIQTMRTQGLSGSQFGHGWTLYNRDIYHYGLLPGSSGELNVNTSSGIAMAVLLNGNSFNSGFLSALDRAIQNSLQQVRSFPEHDLFEETSTSTTPIPKAQEHHALNVWPNPSGGRFSIEIPAGTQWYHIFDITGKIVQQGPVSTHRTSVALDLSEQAPGMYFIQMRHRTKMYHTKLIVQ